MKRKRRKVAFVDLYERGLFMVDGDKKECDFCDTKQICASINWGGHPDVICVCKKCLQEFVDAFK